MGLPGFTVQLDEDGKPCKACNNLSEFQLAMSAPTKTPPSAPATANDDPFFAEPPNGGQLGRSTWTFLHSLAAYYPKEPSSEQQQQVKQLITTFANFYPCKPCAADFRQYIDNHAIDASNRENFSLWMCDAHNAVNQKLGKRTFDCRYWVQRWREGWEDFVKKN